MFLGCSTCIFFTENVTIASSVIESSTYQILCNFVKYFLSYSANRQTDGQTDRQTDRLTEMKDLIFRNLHGLKHEILKKSRRVIFFRFLYFPYVSKGSKMIISIIHSRIRIPVLNMCMDKLCNAKLSRYLIRLRRSYIEILRNSWKHILLSSRDWISKNLFLVDAYIPDVNVCHLKIPRFVTSLFFKLRPCWTHQIVDIFKAFKYAYRVKPNTKTITHNFINVKN